MAQEMDLSPRGRREHPNEVCEQTKQEGQPIRLPLLCFG
jgi:hypothetical protein